jgi:ribonuclease-3
MILHIDDLLKSSGLYKEAFTHKSIQKSKNFERLEFLGDSLVGALVTELLYTAYPKTSEGDLSRWKSTLIGQPTLALLCRHLKLQEHLICKASEEKTLKKNERIQASLFESLLGAYYLDKGFDELKDLVSILFKDKITNAALSFQKTDFKTLFQEAAQKQLSKTPTYKTLEKTGPAHDPRFKVAVCIEEDVFAIATGDSLKEAQMIAAEKAIRSLESHLKKNSKQSSGDKA